MQSLPLIATLFSLLSARRKIFCCILLFLSFTSALLQFFLILTFYPLISTISQAGEAQIPRIPFLPHLFIFISHILPSASSNAILISTFLILIVLSTVIRTSEIFFSLRLSALIGNDFSKRIYSILLNQPFSHLADTNSSCYINSLTTDIDQVVIIINESFLFLVSLATVFGIVAALFLVSPFQSICLFFIIGSSYLSISFFSRSAIHRISHYIHSSSISRIKFIQESFESIRDLILYRLNSYFIDLYSSTDKSLRFARARAESYSSVPRILLEGFLLFLIAISAFYLSLSGSSRSALSFLATFALGAQRLLPSINTLYSTATNIRRYSSSALTIYDIISLSAPSPSSFTTSSSLTPLRSDQSFRSLVFSNVSYSYPNSTVPLLGGISFSLEKCQTVVITGASGSGKSTLIDLILGLLQPSSGTITVNNNLLVQSSYNDDVLNFWHSKIAHVPQSVFLSDSSIAANVAFGVPEHLIDSDLVRFSLDLAHLQDFVASLPHGIDTIIGERGSLLSGGQIQRLGIARALYRQSEVLILDEATSALDPFTESSILTSLHEMKPKPTIVMVTHREHSLHFASLQLKVSNGHVIAI